MIRAAAGLALLPLLLAGGDGVPEGRAFIEVAAPRTGVHVGERVPVTIRAGVATAFLERNMVPTALRPMDLPLRIEAPWLAAVPVAGGAAEAPPSGPTLGLDDAVVAATRAVDVVRDGTPFTVVEIRRVLLPAEPGEVDLSGTRLRFTWARTFEDDALGRRVPVDPRAATLEAASVRLRVHPLPEEGRPAGFTGAVGRFTAEAAVSATEVAAGESLKVTLTVAGEGNLEGFAPPAPEGLEGFHVLGMVESAGPGARRFTWDVAPGSPSVTEVPSLAFSFFDPGPPAGYRTVRTKAVPLTVGRGAEAAPGTGAEPTPGPSGPAPAFLAAAAIVILLGGILLVRARLRAKAPERPDPDARRAREAAAAFRARMAAPGADPAAALADYLAARLSVPVAAVRSPDLPARLAAAGIPRDLAARTAALLDRLTAARYGGAPAAPADASEAGALVAEFDGAGKGGA